MINEEILDTIISAVTWSYEECGEEIPQNILDTLNEIKQQDLIIPCPFSNSIQTFKDNYNIKMLEENINE